MKKVIIVLGISYISIAFSTELRTISKGECPCTEQQTIATQTTPAPVVTISADKRSTAYDNDVLKLHIIHDLKQIQEILNKNINVDALRTVNLNLKSIFRSVEYELGFNIAVTSLMLSLYNPTKTQFLISRNANPNAQTMPHKLTPLMFAVNYADDEKNKKMVEYLIEVGADPYQKDAHGHDAFWHAEKAGNAGYIKFMKNLIKGRREIREAARQPISNNPEERLPQTGIRSMIAEYLVGPEERKKEEETESGESSTTLQSSSSAAASAKSKFPLTATLKS